MMIYEFWRARIGGLCEDWNLFLTISYDQKMITGYTPHPKLASYNGLK